MPHRVSKGQALLGAARVGKGSSNLVYLKSFTGVSINPGSLAGVSRGQATGTAVGVAVNDYVLALVPSGLADDLLFVGARVSAPDVIEVSLFNDSAAPIDDGANSWSFLVFRTTP